MSKRRPNAVETTLANVTVPTPLVGLVFNEMERRQSGECRREYIGLPGSNPGRASGFSRPNLVAGPFVTNEQTQENNERFMQRMPTELHDSYSRGRGFESRRPCSAEATSRGFAIRSWGRSSADRARVSPNLVVACFCETSHDECRWNYMLEEHEAAGSNPVTPTGPDSQGCSSVVERVTVSSLLSSCAFCAGG